MLEHIFKQLEEIPILCIKIMTRKFSHFSNMDEI